MKSELEQLVGPHAAPYNVGKHNAVHVVTLALCYTQAMSVVSFLLEHTAAQKWDKDRNISLLVTDRRLLCQVCDIRSRR